MRGIPYIYYDISGVMHGYIYNMTNTTFTTLDDPSSKYGTVLVGVSGSRIVGYVIQSTQSTGPYFYYDGSHYSIVSDPSSVSDSSVVSGISGGNIIGYYSDGSRFKSFVAAIALEKAKR